MLQLNNYYLDFMDSLSVFLADFEEDKTELKSLDAKIIFEIKSLIKGATNFAVANDVNHYGLSNKDFNIGSDSHFNTQQPISFEFYFDAFSKEYKFNKHRETELPYIIFFVPKNKENFNNISSIIGEKIEGDIAFIVRKVQDSWQLPLHFFSIKNKKIQIHKLFKKLNFDFETNQSASDVDSVFEFYKEDIYNRINEYYNACMSDTAVLMSTENGLLVNSELLKLPEKNSIKNLSTTIERNGNKLYFYNKLYRHSISFKSKDIL